ncbi:MAG: 1-acyl-sn-glycerol-3-phosphate acyltransferase [Clostridia bacterium]|nr:1-acyl-sn-glycerol-3-phosphate acyltransferase [Clostridia bacterium]
MVLLFNFMIKLTGWPLWKLIARPKVYYEDKSVQSRAIKGAAIVMPNHTEVWDVAAMMFLFPCRKLRCVVAELMYEKNAFMTFVLHALGSVRVDRNSHDFTFIAKCCKILEKGGVVEIYPEARIPDKGATELLPFKPSIAMLALESGAPVIPVYTDGRYFPKGHCHMIVGTPIDVREWYDETRGETENLAAITEQLRGKVNELKQQLEKTIERR